MSINLIKVSTIRYILILIRIRAPNTRPNQINHIHILIIHFFFFFQMLFTEIIQAKLSKRKVKTTLFGYRIPTWLENSYRKIGVFAFGSAVSQLTTDIAKYSIGRLRPHFFAVSIIPIYFYITSYD